MCIMPIGIVHILFYIGMGKCRRIHFAYSPSIVLAMRK